MRRILIIIKWFMSRIRKNISILTAIFQVHRLEINLVLCIDHGRQERQRHQCDNKECYLLYNRYVCQCTGNGRVEDVNVVVAGPFNVSGTAALVGALKTYSEMTGETVDEDVVDAAVDEW